MNPVVATALQRPNGATTRVDGHSRRHSSRDDAIMSGIADSTREVPSRTVSSRDRLHGARFYCHCIGVQSAYNRERIGLGNTRHFTIVPATCGTHSHRARNFDIPVTTNVSHDYTLIGWWRTARAAGLKGLL